MNKLPVFKKNQDENLINAEWLIEFKNVEAIVNLMINEK